MITALAARWLFTAVFRAAGLRAAIPGRCAAGSARPALGSGRPGLAGPGGVRRPSLPALLQMLMAVAMTWMLTAMPAAGGIPSAGPARGAMAAMPRAVMPAPVLVISVLLAVSCA